MQHPEMQPLDLAAILPNDILLHGAYVLYPPDGLPLPDPGLMMRMMNAPMMMHPAGFILPPPGHHLYPPDTPPAFLHHPPPLRPGDHPLHPRHMHAHQHRRPPAPPAQARGNAAPRAGGQARQANPNPGPMQHAVAPPAAPAPAPPAVAPAIGVARNNSRWSELISEIMEQVLAHVKHSGTTMAACRKTCKHWRWCVDKTLTSLSLNSLMPKGLVARYPHIEELRMVSCKNVRNRDLFFLTNPEIKLQHMTCLVLGDDHSKPWVSNKGAVSLARMINLRFLALHDCNTITNRGIVVLSSLTNLHTLSLRGCKKLTDPGFAFISHLIHLTRLNLYGCKRFTDSAKPPQGDEPPVRDGLNFIEGLPCLVSLSLGLTRVKLLERLARLTRLTELHLAREWVQREQFMQLSTLTRLEVLSLRDIFGVTANHITPLLKVLPSLKDLSLFNNNQVKSVDLITSIVNLTALDLRETPMDDACITECTKLMRLQRLQLKPTLKSVKGSIPARTFPGYPSIRALTQLTSLTLTIPCCYPVMMGVVGSMTNLLELDLARGLATDNPDIDGEELQDCVYEEVAKLTRLTSLRLSHRKLHPEKMYDLLRPLRKLRQLHLVGCTDAHGSEGKALQFKVDKIQKAFPSINVLFAKKHDISPELAKYGLADTMSVM